MSEIVRLNSIEISRIIDVDGQTTLMIEADEEIPAWDLIGMLTVALDYTRSEAVDLLGQQLNPWDPSEE